MARFDDCLKFVLNWEGGYTNDPTDHGGATNLGIIQTEYDAHRRACGEPTQSVRNITLAEATNIYRNKYWDVMGCDTRAQPMDLVLFDTAVNLGVGQARKCLARVNEIVDPHARARAYCNDRERVYRLIASHPGQSVFLRGWMNRLNALRKAC